MTQTIVVLAAVPVLAALLVVGLRREAVTVETRRRRVVEPLTLDPELLRRLGAALGEVQTAMAGFAPAAARASAAMRGFADALERTHRTTARPAHRAPRGARS